MIEELIFEQFMDWGPWIVLTYLLIFQQGKKMDALISAIQELTRYFKNGRNKK